MAFYSAYFDESGVHDSPILTLAGYIATVEQWEEFAREWSEALNRENVRIFHMKDFENGYGEFNDWTRERKIALQRKLIGIIKRRLNRGFFCSVNIPDFYECVKGYRLELFQSPYSFCVTSCLGWVGLWAQTYKHKELIAYVIEHGAGYNHEISTAFQSAAANEKLRDSFRLGSLTFVSKDRAVQLQAADMLAYEIWKDECNVRLNPPEKIRPRRKSIELLWDHPMLGCYYGKEEFEKAQAMEYDGATLNIPEGVVVYNKPDTFQVKITTESSELEKLLGELLRTMELSPNLIHQLVDSPARFSQLISVETENVPTTNTGDFKVIFKPTDFLLSCITAIRASEGKSDISE